MREAEILAYEATSFEHEFDLWPYLIMWDKVIWMIYNLYPLSNRCFYGNIEMFEVLYLYDDWFDDPKEILVNLIYNFGFVYSNLRDIIHMRKRDVRSPIQSSYSLGLSIGQLYYYLIIS